VETEIMANITFTRDYSNIVRGYKPEGSGFSLARTLMIKGATDTRRHDGVDLGVPVGTPVYTPADGCSRTSSNRRLRPTATGCAHARGNGRYDSTDHRLYLTYPYLVPSP
jgi:murein DD-endopeptidase MepM/ murein hydrolase activator NlpD